MNELFLQRMQALLKDEFPSYLKALEQPPYRGFRINTLKITPEDFFVKFPLDHSPSPYADNGYYTNEKSGIGYQPEYLAGLLYMQEPSASSAVTVLDPKPGDCIVDLCAAPGSKSTQILEKLNHEGILIANEINPKRAKILLENVERNGADNCIVTNSDTHTIAKQFPCFFDKVLCDAPCSGEGMVRKEEEAVNQWSLELVQHCASLQKTILEDAYACLKPGGILVYSTCTLNLEENELQIQQFLRQHEDMELVDSGCTFGRKGLVTEDHLDLTRRIFPQDGGEGHFIAKLHKKGEPDTIQPKLLKGQAIPKEVSLFLKEQLETPYPYLYCYQNRVYGGTYPFLDTGKIHVLRNQVYLGELLKNRFEPSHHFYLSAHSAFKHCFEMNNEQTKAYIHGEQINDKCEKGWTAMCIQGHVLGAAKSDGKALKNKFPKAFRTR